MVNQRRIDTANSIHNYLSKEEYARDITDIARQTGFTRVTVTNVLRDIAFNGKLFKFTDQRGGGWIAIGSPSSPSPVPVEVISSEPATNPVKLATVTPIKAKGIVWHASKPDAEFDPLLVAALGADPALNEYSKGWDSDYMLKRTIGLLIRIHETISAKKAQEK